jgi:hypothetical protein
MQIVSWQPKLLLDAERSLPELVIELGLTCQVCRALSTKTLNARLTYDYGDLVIDRVLVGYEHLGRPEPCDECGVVSRIPETNLSKTKKEVAQAITVQWVRQAVWCHPDFPNSCYANRLSGVAAKKFEKQAALRQERIRLASRTPEQVAADRRYAAEHYWCGAVLEDELEKALFYNQLDQAHPCDNCRSPVYRELYQIGKAEWNQRRRYICKACAVAELACSCQRKGE